MSTNAINWKDKFEFLSLQRQPKFYDQEKIMKAAGKAFVALSVAFAAATTAAALFLTATPIIIIGTVTASAVVTIALLVSGIYLCNKTYLNDPAVLVRIGREAEEAIVNATTWTEAASKYEYCANLNIMNKADINQIYFKPQAEKLTFAEFKDKNPFPSPINEEVKSILKPKYIEYCKQNNIPAIGPHLFLPISGKELLPLVYHSCSIPIEKFMSQNPAHMTHYVASDKSPAKEEAKKVLLKNITENKPSLDFLYNQFSKWLTSFDISFNSLLPLYEKELSELLDGKVGYAEFHQSHSVLLKAALSHLKHSEIEKLKKAFLQMPYPSHLEEKFKEDRIFLFGDDTLAQAAIQLSVVADANELTYPAFCAKHSLKDTVSILPQSKLDEFKKLECEIAINLPWTQLASNLKYQILGISIDDILIHRWNNHSFIHNISNTDECKEYIFFVYKGKINPEGFISNLEQEMNQFHNLEQFVTKFGEHVLNLLNPASPSVQRLILNHWKQIRFDDKNSESFKHLHQLLLTKPLTPSHILHLLPNVTNSYNSIINSHDQKVKNLKNSLSQKLDFLKLHFESEVLHLKNSRTDVALQTKERKDLLTSYQKKIEEQTSKLNEKQQLIANCAKKRSELASEMSKFVAVASPNNINALNYQKQQLEQADFIAIAQAEKLKKLETYLLSQKTTCENNLQALSLGSQITKKYHLQEQRDKLDSQTKKLRMDLESAQKVTGLVAAVKAKSPNSEYNKNIQYIEKEINEVTRQIEKIDQELKAVSIQIEECKKPENAIAIENLQNQIQSLNAQMPSHAQLAQANQILTNESARRSTLEQITTQIKKLEADLHPSNLEKINKQIQNLDLELQSLNSELSNLQLGLPVLQSKELHYKNQLEQLENFYSEYENKINLRKQKYNEDIKKYNLEHNNELQILEQEKENLVQALHTNFQQQF